MTTTLSPKLVGARVKRVEDRRLLTGQGHYVDDHRLPGMLHAAFLRSPHAHARIGRVDVAAARSAPGVVAAMTGDEMAGHAKPLRAASKMPHYKETDMPALAVRKVRYVGEPVAIVVAESRYAAEDAADRIVVEYEPLPPITEMEPALEDGSPLVHDEAGTNLILQREFAVGDVDAALAGAEVVVRDRFRFHRHAGVCMENRCCLAEYDPGQERLTLHSSTQCPNILRDCLADLLDIPQYNVRVVAPDVGGGFGVKTPLYQEETAACVMAIQLRRPVKWTEDRREDLLTTIHAWDEILDVELGLTREGAFVGLRAEVYVDVGAYSIFPWTAAIEPVQSISFLPGPYKIPNYRGRTRGITTNKCPLGPYRGVARPVSTFAMEGMVDRAARRLGMDPTELRLKNYIREFPYKSPSGVVWDSGSFYESMLKAKDTLDYAAFRAEQARLRAAGKYIGLGVASYVELTGVGSAIPVAPGMAITTGMEAATVKVDPSGKVSALFGIASHGQSLETTLAQVVAGEMGVLMDDVKVFHGDTAVSPYGTGTYASRSAVIGGGAGILAGRAVRDKALAIAAHMLEANADDLDLRDGKIWVKGMAQPSLALRDVAKAAYYGVKHIPRGMEPGLEATRFYDPYFGTSSNATHAAVVEVDPETGLVTIRKFLVVEDCGVVINPNVVEGQAHGGVAQGIGGALLEEMVYDEEGQPTTGTLMDYLIPTASDVPNIQVEHLETPSPTALGGFKGMGEGGTIGAPAALANAVMDALTPFGVTIAEAPFTPERILHLIQEARARRPYYAGRNLDSPEETA